MLRSKKDLDNINSLKNRSERLARDIQNLTCLVQQSPGERLVSRVRSNGAYNYFACTKTETGEKMETYIPRDNVQLAEQLAVKEYAVQRLKDLKKEKQIIDDYLKYAENEKHAEKYLKSHPGAAQLIIPKLRKKDAFVQNWIMTDYVRSQDHPENLIFPTVIKDLQVRSKSESTIVDHLVQFGVPMRYEEEVIANGIRLHPDFTCLNPRTHEVFYWEHQGRWDDKNYVSHLKNREDLLRRAGIIPWINLLITTETLDKPLNPNWVDVLIKEFLL